MLQWDAKNIARCSGYLSFDPSVYHLFFRVVPATRVEIRKLRNGSHTNICILPLNGYEGSCTAPGANISCITRASGNLIREQVDLETPPKPRLARELCTPCSGLAKGYQQLTMIKLQQPLKHCPGSFCAAY